MNAMITLLAMVAAQQSESLMSFRVGPEVADCIQTCQQASEANMSLAPAPQNSESCDCSRCAQETAKAVTVVKVRKAQAKKRIVEIKRDLSERPPVQGQPDPRIDELVRQMEQVRKDSDAITTLQEAQKKMEERQKQAEQRLNAVEKGLRDVKSSYKTYDDTNPFSVSIGPRLGLMILGGATTDPQSHAVRPSVFSGFTAGPRLALSLRSWASLFAEGNVVVSPLAVTRHSVFNRRPLSLNGRVGADFFPLGFTKWHPALKGFGLEVAGSTTWTGYSTDLKAQSALFTGEFGGIYRWQIVPRWLAVFAGANSLAGVEFKAGRLPGLAGGMLATAGLDF